MANVTQKMMDSAMKNSKNIGVGVGGVLLTKGTQMKKPAAKKPAKTFSSKKFEYAKKKVFGMK